MGWIRIYKFKSIEFIENNITSSTLIPDIINISIHYIGIITTTWEFGQDKYVKSIWHMINRLNKMNIDI